MAHTLPFVTETAVMAVVTPPPTPTFRPLAHGDLIDELHEALTKRHINVVNKTYSMNKEGQRLFGVWEIEQGETSGALGFRNAHDKRMAVGLTSGTKVFVCSNMAFSGEWIDFKKHTSGMDTARLRQMVENAIGIILDKIGQFKTWHESLHKYELGRDQARLLSWTAMEKGIVPASDLGKVYRLFHDPKTREYEQTLYGWHGSITQTLRDKNLVGIQANHGKLTNLVKNYANWLEDEARKAA
jgi:hypothetical protein